MHLAARFCAKEAVAKALGLTAWSFRDVEVVATAGAPQRAPERARGRAGRGARRDGERLAHPHRARRPARWLWSYPRSDALPGWLDPLFDAAEMRAVDAWAIEEQGVPSLDLMERAGERARAA